MVTHDLPRLATTDQLQGYPQLEIGRDFATMIFDDVLPAISEAARVRWKSWRVKT